MEEYERYDVETDEPDVLSIVEEESEDEDSRISNALEIRENSENFDRNEQSPETRLSGDQLSNVTQQLLSLGTAETTATTDLPKNDVSTYF